MKLKRKKSLVLIIVVLLLSSLLFACSKTEGKKQQKQKEDNRIIVKNVSGIFELDNEVYVYSKDGIINKVDFEKRKLEQQEDIFTNLYNYEKSFFYMKDNNIYISDNKEEPLIKNVDEYKFDKYCALFKSDKKLYGYLYKEKKIFPILNNAKADYIKSLDQILLTGKAKYYVINNMEEKNIIVNEIITDKTKRKMDGIAFDANKEQAKFIMSSSYQKFQDIAEEDIKKKHGQTYLDTTSNEQIIVKPKYYNDDIIFFISSYGDDCYLKFINKNNAEIKKIKLGKKNNYKDFKIIDSLIIIGFSDKFYYGNIDKLHYFNKTYDKIDYKDEMFILENKNKVSIIKDNKIKEYELKGQPIVKYYNSGTYYYIYTDGQNDYIDKLDMGF